MPPSGDDLVVVVSHHHVGQGARQVTLKVSQYKPVVIAGCQQVVGVGAEIMNILSAKVNIKFPVTNHDMIYLLPEPDGTHVSRMRLVRLDGPSAPDVVEDTTGVLVSGGQQASGGVDRGRSDG